MVPLDWEAPYWALRNGLPGSLFRTRLPKATRLKGKTLVLAAPGADGNVWHFFFDQLPKLNLVKFAGLDLASFDHILVNSAMQPYQREAFIELGIPPEKIVQACVNPLVTSDQIFQVTLGCLLPPDAWVLEWLRSEFLKPVSGPSRKIFISRNRAAFRRISSEDKLLSMLPSDLEVLRLEEMSLREQIEAFSAASVVIAPHGAGLTHLTWCAPGTKIVELFSHHYKSVCYWMVANHLKLDYAYAIGDPGNEGSDLGCAIMNENALQADIHFDDLNLLAARITEFLLR
jgi:capsular polysaccharide biosynthesis protein